VVTFDGDGIMVRRANDVAKLTGTPDDFRQYIAGRIDEVRPTGHPNPDSECPDPSVRVDVYDPKGYAAGGVHSFCEGHAVLWKKDDGIWQEIVGSQMGWPCDVLYDHGVPVSVAGQECLEDNDEGTADNVPYAPQ
jgi:hypothetical protein